ncbi:hypothetical protein K1T71_013457 [Dendrolimus kikuchii]|uniref:Uncharacterized protein n=1 Tax=Dendrolimus kikuchii TaxID=765133 RepID=A0ACC1CGH5_9NEOP|nr:hypothetical protein K1T71_013457 [Dendrolimus kikuchii]
MAHLQYMPGDPRLVDQLVYELKSKGIFDQFRKECIADVDTRPAYQNLRQRVETSVAAFLSRQCWKPDLNKNQLREKLRKHILDGNYLEQGVERIVDQVVNPKVASVFIPQVEDLVYNYLGIARKKPVPETSNGKIIENDLLPTDLEAVSPGSVKSNDDKVEPMDEVKDESMDIDEVDKTDKIEIKEDSSTAFEIVEKEKTEQDTVLSGISELTVGSEVSIDKSTIPLPEELKAKDIPPPINSPPKIDIEKIELPLKIDVDKIELPKEPNLCLNFSTNPTDIPLPDEGPKLNRESYFKPIHLNSDDDDSSSDSSLRRNMSPLTPIRNFNNENSCDAQQGFENDSDSKSDDKKEPTSFRFALETKSSDDSREKPEKKETDQTNLSYQFDKQVNINPFNTPMYEDSSNSNNLQIDYESDANSKMVEVKPETENSEDLKRDKKVEEKRSSHKSSHHSRDSHRHSSSKDKRSDSKHSSSRDSSRHDKKPSKDDKSKSSKERARSKDRSDKKDSRDSSKHRSSHKSSSHKDSKSYKSSSSSRHSSKTDNKKDKNNHHDRNDKISDRSKDKRDSKSSSSRSDKDKKSSSSNSKNEKDKKKEKKDNDDHYSLSGRGNHTRRSTDRDSNDGSSSSKGSHNLAGSKNSGSKKESKSSSAKSDNTSTASDSASPSDKDIVVNAENESKTPQNKPVVRVEKQLEVPISSPPRLPFVPDVTLKKPKFAANLQEAKRMMKMRKFLDEEQKRMNQEAALLLEFQANVRPSLSQVYSNISGPELEFACINNAVPLESQVAYEIPVTNTNNLETLVQVSDIVNTAVTYEIPISDHNNIDNEIQDNIIVPVDTPTKEEVKEVVDNLDQSCIEEETVDIDKHTIQDDDITDIESKSIDTKMNNTETYNENKPFSQLVEEITEYSKASEKMRNEKTTKVESEEIKKSNALSEEENKKLTELFEVTIITEELSENEDFDKEKTEITLPDDIKDLNENPLQYFAEHEKYDAEISRHQYNTFFKSYLEKTSISNKLYLINCDTYEENIIKDAAKIFGDYDIVNYYKNGHLQLPKNTNLVKDVNISEEIRLPVDNKEFENNSLVFSPVKSECSFDLSSDYTAKLEEMVNKTSRQQVMEIILGSVIDETPSEMPKIDFCLDVSIDEDNDLKRKIEVESSENNNMCVLTPTKLRKLSDSDQISSTTEEAEEISNNNKVPNNTRSKYLGKARRVGLSRPRKTNLPNSPSSDKSVENYEQNTPTPPQTPNGKVRTPQRKVQRYDTSDLYKPKLHYLSRRNHIT